MFKSAGWAGYIILSLTLLINCCFSEAKAAENYNSTASKPIFISKKPISIEYKVDTSGLDNVNRVVLFISDNRGRTWVKYGEDPDLISPVEFLPTKEGEYYFSVVAYDRAGNDSGLPVEGVSGLVAPVYVDFTPPKVILENPRGGEFFPGNNRMTIKYKVIDSHLPMNAVSIYASKSGGKDGTWQLIKDQLPFEGKYEWQVPNDNIENLAIKIEANDMVGHTGSDMSVKPIVVKVDRPVVSLTGVSIPEESVSSYSLSNGRKVAGETSSSSISSQGSEKTPESSEKHKSDQSIYMKKYETPSKAAFIAFTMAGNMVRQGRAKDALRYYMTALSADPKFIDAMSDSALIYKALGDYEQAKKMIMRALNIAPERPYLYHNLAEVYHAEGFAKLEIGQYNEGMALVSEAVKQYGKAIEVAEMCGKLPQRAASFFRLGEISYFANSDIEGARAYWTKVLNLHTPTPDLSDSTADYERYTQLKIELETWQGWADQYLRQLNNMRPAAYPDPQVADAANNPGIHMDNDKAAQGREPDVVVNPGFSPTYFLPFIKNKIKSAGTTKSERTRQGSGADGKFWSWDRR